MQRKRLVPAAAAAAFLWLGAVSPAIAADDIKLSGCLVRGESGGYLLTNGPGAPAWQRADPAITPGAVGTSGTFASIFYWLRDDDQLRPHVGHRVEIEGELKRQIEDGQIKIDRKDKWTEVEIKADGDTLKARVQHMSIVPVGDGDSKGPILVRRVDVDKIKMISANCS
jgi:hypothetical protein